MKAWTTEGNGIAALRLEERPAPVPSATEVVVAMRAASLNYRDLLVVNGVAHWKPSVPRIPVSDGVGIVTATGAAVTRVRVGDRVAGLFTPSWLDGELDERTSGPSLGGAALDGVLVESRTFDEQAVVHVPDYLTDAEAATLPVAAITAWHALEVRARVKPGETVLVQGTGGVSLFALQLAREMGARVIVTSSTDEKLERARTLGAAETVNYRRTPEWDAEVLRLTGGRGVDHVVETVGGENLNRSLRAVRLSGTVLFIGVIAGMTAPIDTVQFMLRNVTLHGIETGSRAMFEAMNDYLREQGIRPVVDRVFPVGEVREALAYLERGAHFGKVVVAFE